MTRISPRVIIPLSFASFHSTLSKSKSGGGLGKHTASPSWIFSIIIMIQYFSLLLSPSRKQCNMGCPLLHKPFIHFLPSAIIFPSLYLSLVLTQTFPSLEGVSGSMAVLVPIAGNSSKSLGSAFLSVHSHLYRIGSHR